MDSISKKNVSPSIRNLNGETGCRSMGKKKIFLLRHEQRGSSVSFDTPLTPRGLQRAEKIVCPRLEERNIDVIYSSPFVRTLQTIKPFCMKSGLKVNLEWSLVESIPVIEPNCDKFVDIINPNYKPFLGYTTPANTDIIEFDGLKKRVQKFIESLDRSQNILLVTHMPVINAILSYKGVQLIEMYTPHQPGTLLSISGDTL